MTTELSRRPFPDFAAMRDRLDRFFEDVTGTRQTDGSWSVAMDVRRTDDALTVRADVPGLEPEDIKITVEDGMLTIAGEHEESSEQEDEGYVRRERRFGSFRRTMALPPEALPDKIQATTKNGVVQIEIPVGDKPAGTKIEITPKAE
ncbi:Hsp20/alpha crystallin family protein [Baekduia soli]|uniref:Hsp20/alpha crystallin family protein n=1 Tax=Baekduia soli TaxID=496014 RepID=A0A5B8U6Z0_9ACTN|nr:Hsp20/alpha crystallin family protein [Baekduia soli]QEC48727.1 Hsp20/alpha crystallin family protein [Baekduia soli]